MEENFEETGRRLDFEIDHEDDIELGLRRPLKKKTQGGKNSDAGFELFGPFKNEADRGDIDESGSCEFDLGSSVTGNSRQDKSTKIGYNSSKNTAEPAVTETKPKGKEPPQKKDGEGAEELTEEEQERRAALIQRIRQIMASRGGGRVRGDDLRRILGGSGVSFDEALREVVKTYGRALSDDDEGNRHEAGKEGAGLFPKFEGYAGGGESAGKSPYAMREKEQHSDVYAQTGAADMSPDKALKKMRGPYAEDTKCDSCKKGPYK